VTGHVFGPFTSDQNLRREEPSPVPFLGGCRFMIDFRNSDKNKAEISNAVRRLATCGEHHGSHHFAISGEGWELYCSEHAIRCLAKANIIKLPKGFDA
jgi:hypothetical protein